MLRVADLVVARFFKAVLALALVLALEVAARFFGAGGVSGSGGPALSSGGERYGAWVALYCISRLGLGRRVYDRV